MLRYLIPLFLCAACADVPRSAFRAPWVRFVDGGGMAGAFDSSRLVERGDTVQVWLRFGYPEPQRLLHDTTRTFSFTEIHLQVQCTSAQVRELRMLLRDSVEDSLGGYTDPAPTWRHFTAHELREKVLARLCLKLDG